MGNELYFMADICIMWVFGGKFIFVLYFSYKVVVLWGDLRFLIFFVLFYGLIFVLILLLYLSSWWLFSLIN